MRGDTKVLSTELRAVSLKFYAFAFMLVLHLFVCCPEINEHAYDNCLHWHGNKLKQTFWSRRKQTCKDNPKLKVFMCKSIFLFLTFSQNIRTAFGPALVSWCIVSEYSIRAYMYTRITMVNIYFISSVKKLCCCIQYCMICISTRNKTCKISGRSLCQNIQSLTISFHKKTLNICLQSFGIFKGYNRHLFLLINRSRNHIVLLYR